ncbi:MAG TPA: BMP family ABC transporter substrate-binding protein [Candidatus Limnocylindria bacterium]|jgi:basic membrane protein A|nr:BMP family ABC transporter substrate-binding protein [Candidatus Limnocylindria bacterium]
MSRTPRAACLALALVPFVAWFAGCAPDPVPKGMLKVGMVTDVGGLGDRSFNDSAYAGLQRAKRDLHVWTTVLQSRSAADYAVNMGVLANKEYDEIFAIGFLMAKDVTDVSERYPSRHFGIIDAVVDEPNVTSVTFKEEEGSFLAGALAAMTTKTKTIAFLGGIDIPLLRKFEAGFTAGAREVDPNVKVLVKYVGSFEDVASGKELAGVLYDQGADIVYVAAGKAGLGAIDQAKARSGAYVIGVDSNQDALAPGKILTSMVKRVDVGVFRVAQEAVLHKRYLRHLVLGLKEGGVGLTDFRYTRSVVTPDKIATLNRLKAAIIAGKIVVPSTREGLASFTRVPL